MRYEPTVGSISQGTLRTEDLLDAFSYELAQCVRMAAPHLGAQNPDQLELIQAAQSNADCDPDCDEAAELVNDLIDALNEYAPPYCYFGAHEGDGADFGFWPCMDAIEELPRVENSDQAKELGEDCIFVNDHGNVTVYDGAGNVVLELV